MCKKETNYRVWFASGQYIPVTAHGKRAARKIAIDGGGSTLRSTRVLKVVDAEVDWIDTAKQLGFR